MKLKAAALVGMLFFGASVHANTDSPEAAPLEAAAQAAHEHYLDEAVTALSRSSEPRHLMFAARLTALRRAMPGSDPEAASGPEPLDDPTADALVREALRRGANDPLMWWIAATGCAGSPTACDASRATQRLRELDPDNAAVWLLPDNEPAAAPYASTAVSDPMGDDERLDRIAAADRYDTYFGEQVRANLDALQSLPVPAERLIPTSGGAVEPTAEQTQFMFAISLVLADGLPGFSEAARMCGDDAEPVLAAARRDRCIAAFERVLALADSGVAHSVATAQLLRLLPPGTERNKVEQARRRRSWQFSAWAEWEASEDAGGARLDALIAAWRKPSATELGIVRDALRDAGIALDPPPGWRDWGEAETED